MPNYHTSQHSSFSSRTEVSALTQQLGLL